MLYDFVLKVSTVVSTPMNVLKFDLRGILVISHNFCVMKDDDIGYEWIQIPIIWSLGEEPVKLSIEVPRQRFWLTFTFLLETISGLIIKIPSIRTKIPLIWDLN